VGNGTVEQYLKGFGLTEEEISKAKTRSDACLISIYKGFKEDGQLLKSAEIYFQSALQIHNTEVKALTGLAMVYVLTGKYETACAHFSRALELQTSLTKEEEIAWKYASMVCEKIQ